MTLPVSVSQVDMFEGVRPVITFENIGQEGEAKGICYDRDGVLYALITDGKVKRFVETAKIGEWESPHTGSNSRGILYDDIHHELLILAHDGSAKKAYRFNGFGSYLGEYTLNGATDIDTPGAFKYGDFLYTGFGRAANIMFQSQELDRNDSTHHLFKSHSVSGTWPEGVVARPRVGNYQLQVNSDGDVFVFMTSNDDSYVPSPVIRDLDFVWADFEITSEQLFGGASGDVPVTLKNDVFHYQNSDQMLLKLNGHDDLLNDLIGMYIQIGTFKEVLKVASVEPIGIRSGLGLLVDRWQFNTYDRNTSRGESPILEFGRGDALHRVTNVRGVSMGFDYGTATRWW